MTLQKKISDLILLAMIIFVAGFTCFAQSETEYQKRQKEKILNPYHREYDTKSDINSFVRDSLKSQRNGNMPRFSYTCEML